MIDSYLFKTKWKYRGLSITLLHALPSNMAEALSTHDIKTISILMKQVVYVLFRIGKIPKILPI